LFNSAENVVGLHGGGFANMIFCKPSTNILELRTKYTGKIIENLATKSNLNFNTIELEPENIEALDQQGHVHVDIKELEKKIS
jgi:capsular polysaccharide biosynthesis protein